MKLTFGGGANILDQTHDLNNPKVFKRFNLNYFIGCSEERLLRIKRGEGLNFAAENQQVQYSKLINTIKSSTKKRHKKPKPTAYHMLKEAKDLLNNKSQTKLNKLKPEPCPIDTVNTKRVIDCTANNPEDENQANKKFWFQDHQGPIEAKKLANLKSFLIVTHMQDKLSAVSSELKRSENRQSLHEAYCNYNGMRSVTRQNSLKFNEANDKNKGKNQIFLTASEKKMLSIDKCIQDELESEARILKKKTLENLEIAEIVSKVQGKTQSRVKKMMKVDPEYLVQYRTGQNFCVGSAPKNTRSISSMGISDIRYSVNNKKSLTKGCALSKAQQSTPDNIFRTPSLDLKDFSAVAKDFIRTGSQIQKSLRSVFRKNYLKP